MTPSARRTAARLGIATAAGVAATLLIGRSLVNWAEDATRDDAGVLSGLVEYLAAYLAATVAGLVVAVLVLAGLNRDDAAARRLMSAYLLTLVGLLVATVLGFVPVFFLPLVVVVPLVAARRIRVRWLGVVVLGGLVAAGITAGVVHGLAAREDRLAQAGFDGPLLAFDVPTGFELLLVTPPTRETYGQRLAYSYRDGDGRTISIETLAGTDECDVVDDYVPCERWGIVDGGDVLHNSASGTYVHYRPDGVVRLSGDLDDAEMRDVLSSARHVERVEALP